MTPHERGKELEDYIAKEARRRGFKAYRDKRSGAGATYKADIAAPGFDWSIEAKSQSTIKLQEWWNQAKAASPIYKKPCLVIRTDAGDTLAVTSLMDFLDGNKIMADDTATIKELRDGCN